jgi:7,8-dihydropterin-6-yl-methyl-4-(beta-D-ribofuranosyl)aminobenzene 5'-phosphate synthase
MKLRILYDNTIAERGYLPGWGFSCLIGEDLLFDTGEYPEILFGNMEQMGIESSQIKKVVISHDHYDHQGGLKMLLEKEKGLPVYIGSRFSEDTRKMIEGSGGRMIRGNDWEEIAENVFLGEDIEFDYKDIQMSERGIVIRTAEGVTLLTGCSHPGIIKMSEGVRDHFVGEEIYLIAGGFHYKALEEGEIVERVENLQKLGIKKVAPTHCSGEIAQDIFKYYFKDNFISLGAGRVIELEGIK